MDTHKTLAQGTQAGDGLHICLLGAPRLIEGQRPLPLAPVDALLLWRLADAGAQPGEPLARLLWPTQTPTAAGNNLRQRLFRLRRRQVPLQLHGGVLQLGEPATVDLLAPEPGRHFAPTVWSRSELLDGIDLPEGDLAELLAQGRERWQQRRLQLARRHAQDLQQQGDDAQALVWLQALWSALPEDEEVCRALMALHLRRGDRAAAVEAFEHTERSRRQQGLGMPEARSVALLQAALRDPGPAADGTGTPAGGGHVPRAGGAGPLPVALLRPPRLIERQDALQHLLAAWRDARLPLLLGEAGIGKSRLVQEAQALAAADGRQIVAVGCAGLGREPYALLAGLLERLLQAGAAEPDHAPPWDAADAPLLALLLPQRAAPPGSLAAHTVQGSATGVLLRGAACRALARSLKALSTRQPLLVVLDDLHLADDASLEALQSGLAGIVTATAPGCTWLLTARPAEMPPALQALLAPWREGPHLAEIVLTPWSAAGIGRLLDDLHWPATTDAADLQRQVGGNPFHVLEALRQAWTETDAAREGRPDMASTATQRILLRWHRLSEAARQLAELAALAGSSWRVELAAQALGQPLLALVDSWSELEAAQVFAPDAGTIGLAHDLVRVAVLEQLPAPRRQLLCERLATLLAERDDVASAELGRLWQEAARWSEAASAWAAAARQAHRLGRLVEQIQRARQALQAWQRAGQPEQAFDLWFDCSDAMTLTQGTTGLDALIDDLQAWADSPARRGRCAALRAFCRLNQSRLDEALALTDTAEAESPADDHALQIDLRRTRAQTLIVMGRIDLAAGCLQDQQARVDAHASGLQRLQHLATQSLLFNHLRQVNRSIEALQQASALARELGDPIEEVVHRQNLAVSLGHAGRLKEALATAAQAREMHTRLDSLTGLHGPISRINEAQLQLQFGRFGEAIQGLEQALADIPPAAAVWHHAARHRLALAWLWVGQLGRAGALLGDELPAGLPPATRSLREQLRALLLRLEDGRLGPPSPAERACLDRARAAWAALSAEQIPFEHQLRLCRGLPTREALAQLGPLADLAQQRGALGLARVARILHAQALGESQPQEAADRVEALLPGLAQALAVEWLPTEMLLTCAQLLEQAGRADAARRARCEALDWLAAAEAATPAPWHAGLRDRNPWHRALGVTPSAAAG